MNQKYFLCLCHFPHFCSLWGCLFVCFFPLRMSNSHWAAHWRLCVSSVRLIWPLSQSSFSLWLQEQKIYCRGIWPEDNFILREGQRVMGRRKKERKKTTTKENQKTTPSKQKKEGIPNAHWRCFWSMQVVGCSLWTSSLTDAMRNNKG